MDQREPGGTPADETSLSQVAAGFGAAPETFQHDEAPAGDPDPDSDAPGEGETTTLSDVAAGFGAAPETFQGDEDR